MIFYFAPALYISRILPVSVIRLHHEDSIDGLKNQEETKIGLEKDGKRS
jgi:hypothetical protein